MIPRSFKHAVVFVFRENKKRKQILVQKRSENIGKHAGKYAAPGGHYDETDFDTRKTAQREMEEETGWRFNKKDFKLFNQTKLIDYYYLIVKNNYISVKQTSRDEVDKIDKNDFPETSILAKSYGHIWVNIEDFFNLDSKNMIYRFKSDTRKALLSMNKT